MSTPQVSILIPNFNNGRASSADGTFDLLGTLLRSLYETLADDPTPVEIIIADDGSTDDSLETARQWAGRRWRQGGSGDRPVCSLIELEHCGVLSVVANRLMKAASGEVIVRLDGDVEVLTPNWASKLCDAFDSVPPDVGVIGPKQLTADRYVHSAGDWLLHPRGYHHIGQGVHPSAITCTLEVDHVMGCFYCQRRAVWDQIGPYDESIMRGQTVDYGMRARLHGWRCVCVPTIEFIHHHTTRELRSSQSDTVKAIQSARDRFFEKWGFDRVAPDLAAVAKRYAGTPLLWNQRVFGPRVDVRGPVSLDQSRWSSCATDERAQSVLENQLRVITASLSLAGSESIVQIGCGEGVLCHLLAQQGYAITGLDDNPHLIDLARTVTARSSYAGAPPRFEHISDANQVDPANVVLLIDTIHTHPNPVGLLREARRLVRDDGSLLIITPERSSPLDTDIDRHHLYRDHELTGQINATGLFTADRSCEVKVPGVLVKRCSPRSMASAKAARELVAAV